MRRPARPWVPLSLCLGVLALPQLRGAQAVESRPRFTVEDLVVLKRISDPQVSPDGRLLVFVQRETDLAANKSRTSLWLMALAPGARPQQLTDAGGGDSSPRWAPDSRTLYFLSTRSGSQQVWRIVLTDAEARRVTDFPLEVGSLRVSPTGRSIAVSMEVFPDCPTLACTRERLDTRARTKSNGRLYERLFVRHWVRWADGTRSHLFSVAADAAIPTAAAVDVMRGFDADVPGKPFGGDEDFVFSPDGRSLVFTARIAGHEESWSTNFDLYQVPVQGNAAPVDLTADNPAWDAQPVFLANGDLAWIAQERPGFESDRFHIVVRRARSGAVSALTADWDRSVARLASTPDGRSLLAAVDELGQRVLYRVDPRNGTRTRLTSVGEVEAFSASADRVVFARADLGGPADLYVLPVRGGEPRRLTDMNHELLAARHLSEYQQFSFRGWNDETVYGYAMRPFGFEPGQRYPIAFVVHGGPQVSMANLWTYRWNAQAFAGGGYAVVMIDFHGSPGYGQAFTDSITRDWGGKPLVDLQKGLAAAQEQFPWLDGERACALGGSYGGFMMNWIEGNWPDRFRCIVDHDGVFDQRMMYYATEELWFPEWEFGGPYYQNPQGYEQFNPADHVSKWRTPILVIHGEQDFRVPYTQGLASFTAAQRRGIDSRLLIFPEENHWVLKAADSVLWYHTVLGWLDAHLKDSPHQPSTP
ncbi:MAG TPA: S9 family peptidase [Steroidobacteraceae bacterium]|jgi:dipeptidyl aminopeptidase/acylaminoacyl peptidase|nr:S9 family peptidase [Steroidobacteraceae bacterium]